MNLDNVILTDEQRELVDILTKWYTHYDSTYFVYSGPAGTGKTTIIQKVVENIGLDLSEVACLAYVGKAAMVLCSKGLPAKTIHSTIYYPYRSVKKDEDGNVLYRNGKVVTDYDFVLKPRLDPRIKMIFVDEYSMLSDRLIADILSFGLPTVFCGDMNQLPPVMGTSNLLKEPDFYLTKIMRQAEGNPIIELSQKILHGEKLKPGIYGNSRVLECIEFSDKFLTDYDIILTPFNKVRESFNTKIRKDLLKIENLDRPHRGEKVICKKNNWNQCINGFYLVNGMTGIIEDIDFYRPNYAKICFRPTFMSSAYEDLKIELKYINASSSERKNWGLTKYNRFEYAYVINVHVSQGSQYRRVLYFDDKFIDPDTTKRLRYTAITRAIDSIDIVL